MQASQAIVYEVPFFVLENGEVQRSPMNDLSDQLSILTSRASFFAKGYNN